MSDTEVRRALEALAGRRASDGDDPVARLAWRPAWAIRSRRGALKPFLDMIAAALGRR